MSGVRIVCLAVRIVCSTWNILCDFDLTDERFQGTGNLKTQENTLVAWIHWHWEY